MYDLPYYKADDQKAVIEFMHSHPFITLCGCDENGAPVATHVPVLLDERDDKIFLVGHIMKQTDHHRAFLRNSNVLAVFQGPHTYVSASWYVNPQQGSTWNYQTVHAKGTLKFCDDEMLLHVLDRLTSRFENNAASPSLFEKLPGEYVQRLMKAIVAFEIEVTELDHVFKLSQNRDKESYRNIVTKLEKGDFGAQEIAALMRNSNAYNEA